MDNNAYMTTSPIKRKSWLLPGVVAGVVLVAIIAGIVFTNREAARQASAAPAPNAQVSITTEGVDVVDLRIKQGQNVVWEAQDDAEHQLAIGDGSDKAPGFGGSRFGMGQSYSYVFDTPGTYQYYDAQRPLQVKGTVTVEE